MKFKIISTPQIRSQHKKPQKMRGEGAHENLEHLLKGRDQRHIIRTLVSKAQTTKDFIIFEQVIDRLIDPRFHSNRIFLSLELTKMLHAIVWKAYRKPVGRAETTQKKLVLKKLRVLGLSFEQLREIIRGKMLVFRDPESQVNRPWREELVALTASVVSGKFGADWEAVCLQALKDTADIGSMSASLAEFWYIRVLKDTQMSPRLVQDVAVELSRLLVTGRGRENDASQSFFTDYYTIGFFAVFTNGKPMDVGAKRGAKSGKLSITPSWFRALSSCVVHRHKRFIEYPSLREKMKAKAGRLISRCAARHKELVASNPAWLVEFDYVLNHVQLRLYMNTMKKYPFGQGYFFHRFFYKMWRNGEQQHGHPPVHQEVSVYPLHQFPGQAQWFLDSGS